MVDSFGFMSVSKRGTQNNGISGLLEVVNEEGVVRGKVESFAVDRGEGPGGGNV